MEKEIVKYNRIKTELIKLAQCIDKCTENREKEFYQNICLEYSKELKNLKSAIEESYNIKICNCCNNEQKTSLFM